MLNNFIYAQTKDLFLEQLGAGNILDEAIVFIADTKEIWNHGTYYGGKTVVIDSEVSDTSDNAIANKTIKNYIDDADKTLAERINTLEQNGGGGSSEDPLKTYTLYIDEKLTEEKMEANKKVYEAVMAETPASYIISSDSVIAVPTIIYTSSIDGIDFVYFGVTVNDEIDNIEVRDRKYLNMFNMQIRLAEDGTIEMHKQFESKLAKVSMLDEVIAKVDEIPDLIANLPQGETFNYVHIPFEDYPLDEEQLAENAASCTKWLEAYKNNEPLPILCWAEFPNGEGRMDAYQSSDSSLGFFLRMTLGAGNDESFDNVEFVGMLFVNGLLYSTGEVELFISPDEKVLPTINSFKTINGQSIFGEGNINISVDTDSFASKDDLDRKQNKLVNGSTIKSINNETLLGPGNITIDTSVFDATGDNTERPMSQKATTDAINAETERALMVENELFDKIEAHEALTQQASQNAADANAYAQEAFSKSSEAVNIANTAKNAIAALEGINAGAVQEAISETIVQIEQNTTDIEVLKNSHVVLSEEEYAALELKDPDKFYIVYEE